MCERNLHRRIISRQFLNRLAWDAIRVKLHFKVDIFQVLSHDVFPVKRPCIVTHVKLNSHIFALCRFENLMGNNCCISHIYSKSSALRYGLYCFHKAVDLFIRHCNAGRRDCRLIGILRNYCGAAFSQITVDRTLCIKSGDFSCLGFLRHNVHDPGAFCRNLHFRVPIHRHTVDHFHLSLFRKSGQVFRSLKHVMRKEPDDCLIIGRPCVNIKAISYRSILVI